MSSCVLQPGSYGLAVHEKTAAASRAFAGYIALAVLGEAFLLRGFGVKIGLVALHV